MTIVGGPSFSLSGRRAMAALSLSTVLSDMGHLGIDVQFPASGPRWERHHRCHPSWRLRRLGDPCRTFQAADRAQGGRSIASYFTAPQVMVRILIDARAHGSQSLTEIGGRLVAAVEILLLRDPSSFIWARLESWAGDGYHAPVGRPQEVLPLLATTVSTLTAGLETLQAEPACSRVEAPTPPVGWDYPTQGSRARARHVSGRD